MRTIKMEKKIFGQIYFWAKIGLEPLLKLYSTHSIRVTVANLLHMAQLSNMYIQNRLHWLSDSFKIYLQNTIYAANAQHQDTQYQPWHERGAASLIS